MIQIKEHHALINSVQGAVVQEGVNFAIEIAKPINSGLTQIPTSGS
jgi:hypothetical protein